MSSVTTVPICNSNCTCINKNCEFRHNNSYEERKNINKLCIRNPLLISQNKVEDNAEIRRANCGFGFLCKNVKCNYRHRLNPVGRKALIRLYDDYNETASTTSSDKSSASTISEATAAKLQRNIIEKSKNRYDVLECEEIEEQVAKTSKRQENVVRDVAPAMPIERKFQISFADIAKKMNYVGSEEEKRDNFNKMMSMDDKDYWADYDN